MRLAGSRLALIKKLGEAGVMIPLHSENVKDVRVTLEIEVAVVECGAPEVRLESEIIALTRLHKMLSKIFFSLLAVNGEVNS
ncbi:uncharacterized protein G2W53_005848 [Senna tora]|uniref:Uncharacterized protein n=1 Tax=Senna tora TaxID=362788 RepID=A0A834X2Z9_9FABA|nr:uncharacterized protein G2W53_005848 [Senna tora]